MLYRLAAEALVAIHALFVVFVVLGGLLVLRRRRWAWFHLPAAAWGAGIELGGWICPLTPLEKWLRVQGGGTAYEGGFIHHYITPVLYPAGLTREVQIGLGAFVVLLNLAIYWRVWARSGPAPRAGGKGDGPKL